ncbi:hypothetical protein MAP00_000372 [Monascus purpureus]|nr:hypothetical protein MAP00_000372 [Monascus purpureus]
MARIYKETRLDLRPYSPDTVVSIQIPTQESNGNGSAQRRARFSHLSLFLGNDEPIARDEEEFSKRYLATQGSVYFRKRKAYPRTFLWRVVNDNKVLEIHCVDLVKGGTEQFEYDMTLRFEFQEGILPSMVALADLEDHEVLNVFVITASKQLYTLALLPEFFRRSAAIDENVSEWCKSCVPAPLAFSYPHRLHASSPLELFISLDNGSLLRLTRRSGDDGSYWSPLTLDERSWGSSIRGLLKWHAQPSIKYQGRSLDPNTAVAVATTSDQTHLIAVCLNHTLKIWNLSSNRLVATKDLLDRQVQQHESALYTLNASESSFIRVFNAERAIDGGYRYYVITFSPFDDGRFKFWAVKGGLTSDLIIEDLFPDAPLRPMDPDPSGNVFWTIIDFQLKSAEEGKHMELWVLWRNKNIYQLYSLHFDFQSLVTDWSSNWVSTAWEIQREEIPPSMVLSDVVDPTEKWLKFFFYPGRFPPEVLETALVIYQEALRPLSSPNVSKKSASLQERLCSTITSTVALRKYAEEEMDFARYRTDADSKWRTFWQIADDLNKRRFEPFSLSYDTYYDLPWLLLSDSCAVIRECSSTELLLHNTDSELREGMTNIMDRWRHRNLSSEVSDLFEQASFLMKIASSFRAAFPAELESACQAALEVEIFTEPLFSVPDRIAAFQERCNFVDFVSDKEFDSLVAALNERMNVYSLPGEVFYTIIETIPLGFPGKDSDLLSTHFGTKATVNGAQETISHTHQVLFNLLVLSVFLDGEVKQEEDSTFDLANLFSTLIEMLREYEVMLWLCSNVRRCPDRFHNPPADTLSTPFSMDGDSGLKNKKIARMVTILEDLFATHIKPRQAINMPQSYALTLGIRDVLSWVTRQGEVALPNALVFIQCDLLAKGNTDLAWDFLRFQISTSWATYVKGRVYVAMSEFDTAAIYFRKAAYLLSCGKPLGNLHEMSSTLLDIVSVDSFYNGLPKYFQHILSIFEETRSFSHVADFASLALQALESEHKSEEDAEYVSLRNDLLSRLFYASLKTAQFDQAYSALSRYKDRALQKSSLSSLVASVLVASGPGTAGLNQLLLFPTSLVPNISSYIDETLVSLARKQTSFTSFLEEESTFDNSNRRWITDSNNSPDYCRILQAYRVLQNDYRGAAEVAYRNVQRLRKARDNPSPYLLVGNKKHTDPQRALQSSNQNQVVEEDDPESKEIRHELLALINLLACVDKSEAYILVEKDDATDSSEDLFQSQNERRISTTHADEDGNVFMDDAADNSHKPSTFGLFSNGNTNRRGSSATARRDSKPSFSFLPGGSTGSGGADTAARLSLSFHPRDNTTTRRVIVTLDHLRREYQSELDRVSRIERGDWEFGFGDDEGEDEGLNDETMVIS